MHWLEKERMNAPVVLHQLVIEGLDNLHAQHLP
jgi:hypothetical protein